MRHSLLSLWTGALLTASRGLATAASAQASARPTAEQMKASLAAHTADFDYLLGDWEFTGQNRQYGKIHGFWSAARLVEGPQILDEYRVVGDSGETYYVTNTLRVYNAALDLWELVSLEGPFGLQNVGTGRKVGAEIHIEQRFGVLSPDSSLLRIRYTNIRPDGFTWSADRSGDGGKTWTADYQRLEVHRIGPPRTIAPMTKAKK